jgi:uncharacterized damage-inducible protein DinB
MRFVAVLLALGVGMSGRARAQLLFRGDTQLDSAMARERANFRTFNNGARRMLVDAAQAMPADKYGFAPTAGEFKNVRSFSRQLRHLSATNYILAAAALGQAPPSDAGDELGPDSVVTKAQHVAYLEGSFDALDKAIDAIGDRRVPIVSSPISPFQAGTATRLALIAESLMHAADHYGQIVEYLRMNGIVPPASRK